MRSGGKIEQAFEFAALLGFAFLIFVPPAAAGAGSTFWQSAKYACGAAFAGVFYLAVVFALGRLYHKTRKP